jgi:hypothetical protein
VCAAVLVVLSCHAAFSWCEADCVGLCKSLAGKGLGSATECIQKHQCSQYAGGACEPAAREARLKSIVGTGAKISCMDWCAKCGPGAQCTNNCKVRHNPMVNPSCAVRYKSGNAGEYAVKNGETIELSAVYWISNCKSRLKNFAGIDVLEGPPGVSLSLRLQKVVPSLQHCSRPVDGAMVVLNAKGITAAGTADVSYRVRYNTLDGPRQSNHTVVLKLFP